MGYFEKNRIQREFEWASLDLRPLAERADLSVYAYFGRLDLCVENHLNNAFPNLAQTLIELKKEPLRSEAVRADQMLTAYNLISAKQEQEQDRANQTLCQDDLSEFFIDPDMIPSAANMIESFFTPEPSGYNLSTQSPIWDFAREAPPDDTVSTFMVMQEFNPQCHLIGSDLRGHIFKNDDRFFECANFTKADLRNTHWDPATTSITNANFSGADLRGATGMTAAYLATAVIDKNTKLPDGTKCPAIKNAIRALGP